MKDCYSFDLELGYMPAIPEPFYEQWWFGFCKKYVCADCGTRFSKRIEYDCHYVLNHIGEA